MIRKYVHSQDAFYKLSPKKSGETSINLSQEILQSISPNLEKGTQEKIIFTIYREDYVKAVGHILKLLPLYTSSSTSSTEVSCNPSFFAKDFSAIGSFFGENETKSYEVNLYYRQDGRIYLNNLEDPLSKFNIRHFLIEENTTMTFENANGSIVLRLISEQIKDSASVMENGGDKMNVQKIFFGAPGTGKSFQLNEMSAPFESQKKPHIDEAALIKAAVEDAKRKPGKLTLLNAIGFKYSSFLSGKSIKELQNITGYDKVGEFLTGAAAATICPSIKIDEDREADVDHVKEWLTDEKRGENDLLKWLNAVGFVFSDCVGSFQQNELQKTFGLSSYAQAYWLYQGAKVAKMDLTRESVEEVRFVERVTFHPNYSYAQFVGTYKPVQDEDDSKAIVYSYVPGPFMRTYVRAKRAKQNGTDEKFLLIIEEINRANVAAVFGDVFQLLDRKDGVSEYPIAASEDIKRYLKDNGIADCNELKIPSNMYIWATMNSADQGVFPMDTAFKRRWEFEYIGVNEGAGKLVDDKNLPIMIPIPYKEGQNPTTYKSVEWNKLRVAINKKLLKEYRINEDKLMGPFFINLDVLKGANATEESKKSFVKSFKSKVLMYLYEDVAKMNPGKLFSGCGDHPLYSSVCEKFDEVGVEIFGFEKAVLDEMLKQPE